MRAAAAFVAIAAVPVAADATVYLSAEAALRAVFAQAESFEVVPYTLNAAQLQTIAQTAGPQAAHGQLRIWAAKAGGETIGHVFVDEVVGRQDFITYAVGIDNQGVLRPVEILEYRESHGGEIRNKRWLAQFAGRSSPQQLRFATDIKNIAGATLSSEHVTAGVRRIIAIHQILFGS